MKGKRILFITPYPNGEAPSQRFRFEQYFDLLKRDGFIIDQAPFFDLKTWKILYKRHYLFHKSYGILKGILKRIVLFFKLKNYDVIFIHREACPIGPPLFELLYRKSFRKKIVFDFDDSIWLNDVSDANIYWKWLKYSSKTEDIIHLANLTIAGNNYLAAFAKHFNENVAVIPTSIDTSYHAPVSRKQSPKITIGWTGTSTTLRHFKLIENVLKKICERYPGKIQIMVIANRMPQTNLEITYKGWSKHSEIPDLQLFDIGIMPLPDDDWARGKCGFKGLQYMSLEIPTIMSPVGVNTEIIQDGVNGFLAQDDDQWLNKLCMLIENEALRKQLGSAGRQTIIEKYSVNANYPKYKAIFQS